MPRSDSQGSDGAAVSSACGDPFRVDLMVALRRRRERAGLTRAELGTLAGLGVSYVGMMENGHINPRVSTVLKLVQIIDARQGLNREVVDILRDLMQFVGDLRGWIGNTSETLKRDWPTPSRSQPVPAASPTETGKARAVHARLRSDIKPEDEGRSPMTEDSGLTLSGLLALADKKLGSRKETRARLGGISTQRLYSATHGGPPLRSERVVRLAVIAGIEPTDALRAGGHATLAELLEEAYLARLKDITLEDARLLVEWRRLPASAQDVVRSMVSVLASQQSPAAAASQADV